MIVWEKPADFEKVEIYPLSDLHIGDPSADIPAFQKFSRFILEQPNRFLILNGDLMNNAIKSSVSNVYAETMNPREQKKWLKKELKPLRDRILCIVPGNHEERTSREVDQNPTEDIADHLGLLDYYAPDEAFLKISFGKRSDNGKNVAYSLYVVHGAGGGKRPGAVVNNIELSSMAIDNLDVMVMGHAHKKIGYKYRKRIIDMYNNQVRFSEVLTVVSASWVDFSAYAARKMLIPGAKGSAPIILSGREKKAEVII
jgi:UDP-2,3-diacylglucosamine pyrophosphatase LpxH